MRASLSLLLVPLTVAASLPAQGVAWPAPASRYYAGSIAAKGGELAIQVALTFADDGGSPARVSGEYRYASKGIAIQLGGSYDAEHGELRLDEFYPWHDVKEPVRTGTFVGKAAPGCVDVKGTWTSAKGGAGLPFALHLVAVERATSVCEPLAFAWDEGVVHVLGDGQLASAASQRGRRDAQQRLDAGPSASRDVREWLDASAARLSSTEPKQVSGGHRMAVHFCSDRFVSLGGRVWEFCGGAHPNHGLTAINLALRGDDVCAIHVADLAVGPGAAARLHRLVYDDLRRLGASQVDDPKDHPRELASFDCCLMSPAGVLFGFAPYEVGSYAEGCYFVQLDWTKLRGVLVPPPELVIAAAGK